jgi:hypothetical protein
MSAARSVNAVAIIDDDDDIADDDIALEEPEGPKQPEAAFQPAKTEARKELAEAVPPHTVSDHVNLALTDQYVYKLNKYQLGTFLPF